MVMGLSTQRFTRLIRIRLKILTLSMLGRYLKSLKEVER
jgi:hypothetical protein